MYSSENPPFVDFPINLSGLYTPIVLHKKLVKVPSRNVNKGWGSEKWLFNTPELCGKILTFNEGAEFSMHNHQKKYEFFLVTKGRISVTGIDTTNATKYTLELGPGEVLEVPRTVFHQIKALEASEIIEFSTMHEDSDSYRVIPGDSQK